MITTNVHDVLDIELSDTRDICGDCCSRDIIIRTNHGTYEVTLFAKAPVDLRITDDEPFDWETGSLMDKVEPPAGLREEYEHAKSIEQRHELRGTKAISEQLADLREVKP